MAQSADFDPDFDLPGGPPECPSWASRPWGSTAVGLCVYPRVRLALFALASILPPPPPIQGLCAPRARAQLTTHARAYTRGSHLDATGARAHGLRTAHRHVRAVPRDRRCLVWPNGEGERVNCCGVTKGRGVGEWGEERGRPLVHLPRTNENERSTNRILHTASPCVSAVGRGTVYSENSDTVVVQGVGVGSWSWRSCSRSRRASAVIDGGFATRPPFCVESGAPHLIQRPPLPR